MSIRVNRWVSLCCGLRSWSMGLLLFICLNFHTQANPTDPNIVSGQAQFNQSGSLLEITTSDRVLIEWKGFSIDAGETTQFIQPGSNSLAVNRVTGLDPSALYGTLAANGRVMVINPNGILVGAGGVIDTGGFIASTLDAPNDQLLGVGDWLFSGGSSASVINQGNITSTGDVILIAREVENTGSITAGGLGWHGGRPGSFSGPAIRCDHGILCSPGGGSRHS
jgi:filamentous hemagglutinin family protein